MAEWWAAASWQKRLAVDMDVLFVVIVTAPLHCAAAQLVARARWLPHCSASRALRDGRRRLSPQMSLMWRASCCCAPSWPGRAGVVCPCGGSPFSCRRRRLIGLQSEFEPLVISSLLTTSDAALSIMMACCRTNSLWKRNTEGDHDQKVYTECGFSHAGCGIFLLRHTEIG